MFWTMETMLVVFLLVLLPRLVKRRVSKTPWQNYGTFAVIVPHLKFFIRYPLAGPSAAQVIEVTKSLKKMIYFRS